MINSDTEYDTNDHVQSGGKRKNQKNKNQKDQKGGNGKVIPLYKEPVNSPFIPNIQKEIYQTKKEEMAQKQQALQGAQGQGQHGKGEPLVNLQVYQQQQSQKQPRPSLFAPITAPSPYYPPQFSYQLPPYMYYGNNGQVPYPALQPVPVINRYNINIDGVHGDHSKVSMIYEDMLPSQYGKPFSGTSATIGERMMIYSAIKGMMFTQGDGKDIDLSGKGENSLLSHLKFMDLNPYNTYQLSPNPYKGLPLNFLIYRSCYPIRYDQEESSVVCARNSVGMNVRIYRMTDGAFALNRQQSNDSLANYEELREIAYYEYVREYIIRKKQSPNFVNLHGFYISQNSGIDFNKIAQIRGITQTNESAFTTVVPTVPGTTTVVPVNGSSQPIDPQVASAVASIQQTLEEHCDDNTYSPINPGTTSINSLTAPSTAPSTTPSGITGATAPGTTTVTPIVTGTTTVTPAPLIQPYRSPNQVLQIPNPQAYTGKALVAITESANYNLFGWASKTYQVDGNIKRQINTGFHLDKVWFSVLFQIMVGMYALQINKIYFNNFTLEDNVYIKDLNVHGNVTKYWKYKVDGIDYYIPNYGYLALIDSNYKDLQTPNTTILKITPNTTPHKIYSSFLGDNITTQPFDAFASAIDTNIFSQQFLNNGGCQPPPEVLSLMTAIHNEAISDTNKDIGKYLYTYMKQFMNNRIGTYLKETEVMNIRKDAQKVFNKGDMVVFEDGSDTYKFVLYIELLQNGVCKILTKTDPTNQDIIEMEIPATSLYQYSKAEPVQQNFKPNESILNEEELLETYIINKN